MSSTANDQDAIDLRWIAAATAVVLSVVAAAAVAYLLLDILLLVFLGIVLAAALQPWHVVLSRWGVPKGVAVLLIYLLLLAALVLIVLTIGPMLIEQVGTFVASAPANYSGARSRLLASAAGPAHFLGQRLPPLESLAPALSQLAPSLFGGTLDLTASILKIPIAFVSVLAIGFYWTMEVPRFERLLLSLIAVEQRPRVLGAWREIESRLGGFLRGQGLAMLAIGASFALGYALIGLPNVLALGVLAGLLEAIPWIGPILAVVPALLVATPMGAHTVLLVLGLAVSLQFVESNVLIPRIMHRTVGVSALVGLLSILAFGALYGILGVFIAIPMAAVLQVLLDAMVIDVEPVAELAGAEGSASGDPHAQVRDMRRQARIRLRARTTRIGAEQEDADRVVDAADEQIEVAAARVERLLTVTAGDSAVLAAGEQAALVDTLRAATVEVEQAVERVDATVGPGEKETLDELDVATRHLTETVEEMENVAAAAHTTSAVEGSSSAAASASRSRT